MMEDILDDFVEEPVTVVQTKWLFVFGFGLIFAYHSYIKWQLFFMCGVYSQLFPVPFALGLIIVSIPIELVPTILFLRKKHLAPHFVPMFITCTLYLIPFYSFVILKSYIEMFYFKLLFHGYPSFGFSDIMMFSEKIGIVSLSSFLITIITILIVNYNANNEPRTNHPKT